MLMQSPITDLPLGKMTSIAVAISVLITIFAMFAWKHAAALHKIIEKLIEKLNR